MAGITKPNRTEGSQPMTYWVWLIGISFVFTVFERVWPRRQSQRLLRRGLGDDLVYVILNGHFLGMMLALPASWLQRASNGLLAGIGVNLHVRMVHSLPLALQFLVAFFVIDFIQWLIHNLMHRIPWFWEFHKVHHSIEELDWLGSLRFHWMEIAIYKIIQYPALAFLGFDYRVLFVLAVVSTLIGHFNHANLRFNLGPLKFFLNSPEMHEWHHTHPNAGPINKNFGINLALWDWIFGTAFLPGVKGGPARLGFEQMEGFPKHILLQELWPISAWFGKSKSKDYHPL